MQLLYTRYLYGNDYLPFECFYLLYNVYNIKPLTDYWRFENFFLFVLYNVLTHLFPMHPFSTPCKHQKIFRFSDVFRGLRKGALGTNGLIWLYNYFLYALLRWRLLDLEAVIHCVKSIRIRSYSGPFFPTFGLNTDQNNSEYGLFLRCDYKLLRKNVILKLPEKYLWRCLFVI